MDNFALFFALLIGFVAGWFVRSRRSSPAAAPDNGLAYKLQQRDEELRAARSEIAVHTSTLDTLRNEIAILTKKTAQQGSDKGKGEAKIPSRRGRGQRSGRRKSSANRGRRNTPKNSN